MYQLTYRVDKNDVKKSKSHLLHNNLTLCGKSIDQRWWVNDNSDKCECLKCMAQLMIMKDKDNYEKNQINNG